MINKLKNTILGNRDGLRGKTLVAAFWSLIGSAGGGLIRFASNLILTRLLFPEAFGLMATAMVVLALVQLFSDTGIKTALIQNPRGNQPEYVNTSFIIANIRSIILFAVVLAAARPLAVFYGQPELSTILLIMSGVLLVDGLINPALPLLIKSLRIEKQVSFAIGSQLAGFVSTLLLVYYMRSVTALALGYLLTYIYRLVGSYIVYPYRPRFEWDRQAGKELFNFGKYIIVNTMVGWAVLNIDRMIIGKTLDMEQLGYYNIALYLGVFISDVLVQVFAQSYFPAVSSISDQLEKVQEIYRKTMSTVIYTVAPVLMLIVLFSKDIISILYDPRYALAGTVLFWLGLKSILHILTNIQSGTMLAIGKPAYITVANAVGLVFLVVTLPKMSSDYGLTGSGIAVMSAGIIIAILQSLFMVKYFEFKPSVIYRPWMQLIFVCLMITAFYLGIEHIIGISNVFVLMVLTGLAAAGVAAVNLLKSQLLVSTELGESA